MKLLNAIKGYIKRRYKAKAYYKIKARRYRKYKTDYYKDTENVTKGFVEDYMNLKQDLNNMNYWK